MNDIKNVSNMPGCIGCGLCANVCSKDAISMKMSADGYIVPEVDSAKCVNCGLCVKQCVVRDLDEPKVGYREEVDLYAAWNTDDEVRRQSSSGGVFSAVAEAVIAEGGCVFGVKWKDKYRAEFACAETSEQLREFRGSKYLPAFPGDVYRQVKDRLKQGRKVLFAGTPCQVRALNHYLKKAPENLLTIDIVCHGMPSYNIYKLYVNEFELESGKTLERLYFRDKKISWEKFNFLRVSTDGEETAVFHRDDDFMRVFLSNKALNHTCYNCPFIRHGRQGDITLGDFWGIRRSFPQWDVNKGVSVALINSQKGKSVWSRLSGSQLDVTPVTEDMIQPAASYTIQFTPYPKKEIPAEREEVLAMLRQEKILSPVISRLFGARRNAAMTAGNKNVALLGWWYARNYGAKMTSLALYKLLEDMGYHPTMVWLARPYIDLENVFMRKLGIRFTPEIKPEEQDTLNNHFDTFVVGSDQLWRYSYIRHREKHAYFLDFVSTGKRRIAYGTSLGTNPCEAPEDFRQEAAFNLSLFTGVSSREREGVEVLKKQYNTDATFVLDPVFMCSAEQYREWASLSNRNLPSGDYVCSYIMDKDVDGSMAALIKHVCAREQADMINMLNIAIFDQIKATLSLENVIDNLAAEDWLYYIANCKHLITDSFHGMCFALIFNKPFTVVGNAVRGNSRFTSMLEEFGMKEYLVDGPEDITRVEQLPPVNWNKVNETLDSLREFSAKWLKEQLEKPLPDSQEQVQYLYSMIRKLRLAPPPTAAAARPSSNNTIPSDDIALLLSYKAIWWKYQRYKIASKITFGKTRKKYKQKKKQYKQLISKIRAIRNKHKLLVEKRLANLSK